MPFANIKIPQAALTRTQKEEIVHRVTAMFVEYFSEAARPHAMVLIEEVPDGGYGPWEALNPFEIWMVVVLVSTLSFAGFVAMRLLGERQGLMIAATLGALVSSTAVNQSGKCVCTQVQQNVPPWALWASVRREVSQSRYCVSSMPVISG